MQTLPNAAVKRRATRRGNVFLNLDDAPTFEPVILTPAKRPARADVLIAPELPTFGLTPADVEAGKRAEFERAELRAWSMIRICQECSRRFVPARRNCGCCSRRCYLKLYRKINAALYRAYTRKWRANGRPGPAIACTAERGGA